MSGGLLPVIARDRIWEAFRALVRLETQQARYLGTYEYTIQATDGATVDATANDTSTGMPDVSRAELRADTIATHVPTVGNLCHITFVDGNPAKPKCTWCQPAPASAAVAGGGPAVTRVGDAVRVEFTATVAAAIASQLVCAGSGSPPTVAPTFATVDINGTAQAGSTKVTCG